MITNRVIILLCWSLKYYVKFFETNRVLNSANNNIIDNNSFDSIQPGHRAGRLVVYPVTGNINWILHNRACPSKFKAIGQIASPKYHIVWRGKVALTEQTSRFPFNYLETQNYVSGKEFLRNCLLTLLFIDQASNLFLDLIDDYIMYGRNPLSCQSLNSVHLGLPLNFVIRY